MDFKQTQQSYIHLKSQFEQDRVTVEEFEARVNELVVNDFAGAPDRTSGLVKELQPRFL